MEVAYVGTAYSGFQVQQNAITIQSEIERALKIFYKTIFELTGSSRTDAGVHAYQNFFHFDTDVSINVSDLYNLNSLLKYDIVIKNILPVKPDAHCRFDAVSRTYQYNISRRKNPFLYNRAYYYPFKLNTQLLQQLANEITLFTDFTSFSKRKTQVNHFNCKIEFSRWTFEESSWQYEIKGDRFLRGMVKAVVGTLLHLAKQNADSNQLKENFLNRDCAAADFSPPSHGLFLLKVDFHSRIFY